MRSDQLQIQLRQRTPWEAADLGFQITRTYAKSVWAAWSLAFFPSALLIGLVSHLLFENLLVAAFLLWWLKPIFDVPVLHVLSRAVFGETLSPKQAVKMAWQRANWGQLLRWITYRRLHPARALYLPVDFLERETGARRSTRTGVLARAQGSPASLLTIIGIHLEAMLMVSILMLGLLFVPNEFLSDAMRDVFDRLFSDPPIWFEWIEHLVYACAIAIFEPFYVGAGFGLYLNRRMELEAWDVDLSFRNLAERLGAKAHVWIVAGVAAFLLITSTTPTALAQSNAANTDPTAAIESDSAVETTTEPTADSVDPTIAEVLADQAQETQSSETSDELDEDENVDADSGNDESSNEQLWEEAFGDDVVTNNDVFDRAIEQTAKSDELNPQIETTEWLSQSKRPRSQNSGSWNLDWLGKGVGFLAQNIVYVILIVLLILIAPYLLQLVQQWQPALKKSKRSVDALGQTDVDLPESLPDDLAAQVSALWQQGNTRGATALMYRAGVLKLFDLLGSSIPKGATESQCLRRARELEDNPQYRQLFQDIVRYWQGVAYASKQPRWTDLEAFLQRWQHGHTPLELPPAKP
jgi:hypothetical protein